MSGEALDPAELGPLATAVEQMLSDPRDGWAKEQFVKALFARSKRVSPAPHRKGE